MLKIRIPFFSLRAYKNPPTSKGLKAVNNKPMKMGRFNLNRSNQLRQPIKLSLPQQDSDILKNYQSQIVVLQKEVITFYDKAMKRDPAIKKELIKNLVSLRVNQEKDKCLCAIYSRTKARFANDVLFESMDSKGKIRSNIAKYVRSSLDEMIEDTKELTKHIGVDPQSWAVASPISGTIVQKLSGSPRFREINGSLKKEALEKAAELMKNNIHNHYAKKYGFPTTLAITSIFNRFYANLDTTIF